MQINKGEIVLESNSSKVASNRIVSKLTIDNLNALIDTCSEFDFNAISRTKIGISSSSRLAIFDILNP